MPTAHYCLLLATPLEVAGPSRHVHVVVTDRPFLTTYRHNARLVPFRETREFAPYWQMVCVLGPFVTEEAALCCAADWSRRADGRHPLESWRAAAPHLAAAARPRVRVYMDTVAPPCAAVAALLRAHAAPVAYLADAGRLDRAAAQLGW
jgi:hypothetical protein